MPELLGAGTRAVGELYGYCKVPGVCIESDFDNAPYRDCLKEKFESLGLTDSYCGVFRTSDDREKWRKCVEVSIMQQTAGENLAQQGWDRTEPRRGCDQGVPATTLRSGRIRSLLIAALVLLASACASVEPPVRVAPRDNYIFHDTRSVGPFTVERWVARGSPEVSPAGMCECITVVHWATARS